MEEMILEELKQANKSLQRIASTLERKEDVSTSTDEINHQVAKMIQASVLQKDG